MIDRLYTALRALADHATPVADLERTAGDFADALRLTIDCPQVTVEPEARRVLAAVERALDAAEGRPGGLRGLGATERAALAGAARRALAGLGVAP